MDLRSARYGARRLRTRRIALGTLDSVCWRCSAFQTLQELSPRCLTSSVSTQRRDYFSRAFSSASSLRAANAATATDSTPRESESSRREARSRSSPLSPVHRSYKLFRPKGPKDEKLVKRAATVRADLRRWEEEHRSEVERAEKEDLEAKRALSPPSPLAQLLQGKGSDNANPSYEDDEEWDDDPHRLAASIPQPGDLFGYYRNADSVDLGVYVRRLDGVSFQMVPLHGDVTTRRFEDVQVQSAGFIPKHKVDAVLEFMPNVADPQMVESSFRQNARMIATREIVTKMQKFEKQLDLVYRQNSEALDAKSSILSDESHVINMSLEDATRKLLNLPDDAEPTDTQVFAVWRNFHEGQPMSNDHGDFGGTLTRTILPRRDLEILELVNTWWCEYVDDSVASSTPRLRHRSSSSSGQSEGGSAISEFLSKSRSHIEENRKTRPVSLDALMIGPTREQPGLRDLGGGVTTACKDQRLGTWSLNDIVIIRFLEILGVRNLLGRQTNSKVQFITIAIDIVKAVGIYPQDLGYQTATIRMFMRELGVIDSWSSDKLSQIALPGSGVDNRLDRAYTKAKRTVMEMSAKGVEVTDSMSHMRKDWGQLNVYCVDGESTREFDDGISIEPVHGDGSRVWLHVHVAHPTAMLHPGHAIEECARFACQSYYGTTGTIPMLPGAFSERLGNLGKDSPCLTFSCLFSEQGEMEDYQITPGVIRNVHHITTETWDRIITGTEAQRDLEVRPLVYIGHNKPPARDTAPIRAFKKVEDLDFEQAQELKDLSRLLSTRLTARLKTGSGDRLRNVYKRDQEGTSIRVHYYPARPPDRTNKRSILGDPTIEVSYANGAASEHEKMSVAATDLVAEAMISACTMAAMWCGERDVPALYRYTHRDPSLPAADEYFEASLKPLIEGGQEIPFNMLQDYQMSLGSITSGLVPKRHEREGVGGYLQVTSPLRRYTDMLAHFQIDSVLKREFREKDQVEVADVTGQANEVALAFSRQQMRGRLLEVNKRRAELKTLERREEQWWKTMFVLQAFHFGKIKLPPLTGILYPTNLRHTLKPMPQFQLDNFELQMKMHVMVDADDEATRMAIAEGADPRVGDTWEVEVVNVFVEDIPTSIVVKPKRLISRMNYEELTYAEKRYLHMTSERYTFPKIRGVARRAVQKE